MSAYLFLFASWYASHLRVQLQVFARGEGVVQCVELGTVPESLLYSAQVFQDTECEENDGIIPILAEYSLSSL